MHLKRKAFEVHIFEDPRTAKKRIAERRIGVIMEP